METIWISFKRWRTKVEDGVVVPDMQDVVNNGHKNADHKKNGNGDMRVSVDIEDWAAKKSQFTEPDDILN